MGGEGWRGNNEEEVGRESYSWGCGSRTIVLVRARRNVLGRTVTDGGSVSKVHHIYHGDFIAA